MSETGIVSIHGKKYLTVGKRISDFRDINPEWEISTEILDAGQLVLVKTTIKDENGKIISTGHAEEERGSTNINRTSAIENAETSSVGRALAFMGRGGTEIASADEVVNAVHQQGQKDIYERAQRFTKTLMKCYASVVEIQRYLASGELEFAKEAWRELTEQEQMDLWLAPTKGGCFTTNERAQLKGLKDGE